jgi:hypothetical protein
LAGQPDLAGNLKASPGTIDILTMVAWSRFPVRISDFDQESLESGGVHL